MMHFIDTLLTQTRLKRAYESHPYISSVVMAVALPIGILSFVFLSTFVVITPLAFLMGWL